MTDPTVRIRIAADGAPARAELASTLERLRSISRQLAQMRNAFVALQSAMGAGAGLSGLASLIDGVRSIDARLRLAAASTRECAPQAVLNQSVVR